MNASTALQFDTPAPMKLRCRITGANIIIGMHYGYCGAKGGAKYKLEVIGLGASLELNAAFFKLKSLDTPFEDRERITAERYGASLLIGGKYINGYRVTTKSGGHVRGYMAGLGFGFTADRVMIKLDRVR